MDQKPAVPPAASAAAAHKPAAASIKINLKSEAGAKAPAATTTNTAAAANAAVPVTVKLEKSTAPPAAPVATKADPKKPPPTTPAQTPASSAPVAAKNPAASAAPAPKPAAQKSAPKTSGNDMIKMATGEKPIHISNKAPKTYTSANWSSYAGNFKQAKTNAESPWDMVIINHKQRYNKAEIIEALFNVTGNSDFYPIAYRPSKIGDLFLLRNCPQALRSLFNAGLRLQMADGQQIELTIKFAVGPYLPDQIRVRRKLEHLLQCRRVTLVKRDRLAGVLDLSALGADPSMVECFVNFGAISALSQLVVLMRNWQQPFFASANGLVLAGNGLQKLALFRQFQTTYLQMLDISDNNIQDVAELQGLEKFVFADLLCTGNPFTAEPNYQRKIKEMFKTLKTINGTDVSHIQPAKNAALVVNPAANQRNDSRHPPASQICINPAAVAAARAGVTKTPAHGAGAGAGAGASANPPPPPPPKLLQLQSPATPTTPQPVPPPTAAATAAAAAAVAAASTLGLVPNPVPLPVPAPVPAPAAAPAPVAFKLSVKSFAAIGRAPLPDCEQALAGGLCAAAGDVVDESDCSAAGATASFRRYLTSTMWHRVVVAHRGLIACDNRGRPRADDRKRSILDALWRQLGSTDCQPCYYTEYAHCDTFFVRNSFEALERLFAARLRLQISIHFVPLQLHMNVATYKSGHIDAAEQIHAVIGRCFAAATHTLDLSAFAAHAELRDVEVRLTNAATLSAVLNQAARRYLGAGIRRLRLAGNGLTGTGGMRALLWMKELQAVDLSGNAIASVEALRQMPTVETLCEFALHGNPLERMQPWTYVQRLRELWPQLRRLDGRELDECGVGGGVRQQNYVCVLAGYDLVEQFCEQYFAAWDGAEPGGATGGALRAMRGLYAANALVTLSWTDGEATAAAAAAAGADASQLVRRYRAGCRGGRGALIRGAEAIEARWREVGRTEHAWGSFTVDLVHMAATAAVLTVGGVFRESGGGGGEVELFGFVRTFVLRRVALGMGLFGQSAHWEVVNEMVLVYRATEAQVAATVFGEQGGAGGLAMAAKAKRSPVDGGAPLSGEERDGMVIVMQEITGVTAAWCERFLDQAHWRLRQALELFVHMCEEDKLPDDAFVELAGLVHC